MQLVSFHLDKFLHSFAPPSPQLQLESSGCPVTEVICNESDSEEERG